jgi:membrane protein
MALLRQCRQLAKHWASHGNGKSAAAIAFFAVFTFAPMLIFAVAIASLFVGSNAVEDFVGEKLVEPLGSQGASVGRVVLENAQFVRHGLLPTVFSVLILFYGSSTMFYHLRSTLTDIFDHGESAIRHPASIGIRGRMFAALFVIVCGLLLVSTLLVNSAFHVVGLEIERFVRIDRAVAGLMAHAYSLLLTTLVFGTLLRFLPASRPTWRHVWPGLLVSVALFEVGQSLLTIFISRSLIASAYGPSSSIVAFILWIYYSTQILLLGAEVSALSHKGDKRTDRSAV